MQRRQQCPRVSHAYAVSQRPKEGNRRLEWSSCPIPLLPLDEQLRELELDFVEISGRNAAEMEREGFNVCPPLRSARDHFDDRHFKS